MYHIEIEIQKVKKQITEICNLEKAKQNEIIENENKLAKLKKSLDKAVNNFAAFDKLNNSFKNTTQLQFVNSWVDYRASLNLSEKSNSFNQMDQSCAELRRESQRNKQDLDNLKAKRRVLEKKLSQLESQKINMMKS